MADTSFPQSTTDQATRRCRQCGIEQPLNHFRKRGRHREDRHHECRRCHASSMREHRRAKRAGTKQGELSEALARMRAAKTLSARLTIIDELRRAFPQDGSLSEAVRETLQEAVSRGNHRQTVSLLTGLMEVVKSIGTSTHATTIECLYPCIGNLIEPPGSSE